MREITECQIIFPPGKSKIFRISSRLTFDYERFKFNSEAELTGRRVNNLDLWHQPHCHGQAGTVHKVHAWFSKCLNILVLKVFYGQITHLLK